MTLVLVDEKTYEMMFLYVDAEKLSDAVRNHAAHNLGYTLRGVLPGELDGDGVDSSLGRLHRISKYPFEMAALR